MNIWYKLAIFFGFAAFVGVDLQAQVNGVQFGRNRVQYRKFNWQYYRTTNFDVYYYEDGEALAKFVAQIAEDELPKVETATERSMEGRVSLFVYNDYKDKKQANLGLQSGVDANSNTTTLVANKMLVYFDANHAHLKTQVREGIANIILQNTLFGEGFTEVAQNQAFLDFPDWYTKGYVAYIAENWNTTLDDDLRSEMLSGDYKNFKQFIFEQPQLGGHAFWYFIEELYKKENVTYFMYLSRIHRSINKASEIVTKLPFKELVQQFMTYEEDKYYDDIKKRKAYPKGSLVESFELGKRLNYYRFNVNPLKRNNSFVHTRFKNGELRIIYNDGDRAKTIMRYGAKNLESAMDPNYPIMAWDNEGKYIAIVYAKGGKTNMFIYDVNLGLKNNPVTLDEYFDQVQDVKYMPNGKKLLFSAVKNGHTDIFVYDIENKKARALTNDVYDKLDATPVAFPNKTGVIFSSNRPSVQAVSGDTVLPSNNRYNIFLVTDFGGKPELNQLSQLTKMKYGNARWPMQYNNMHFTFVSDDNGIKNRYAGYFNTENAGLDTIVMIGEDFYRNPMPAFIDSVLRAQKRDDVDSVAVVSVTNDSTYVFPLTNYPSNIQETRIAGANNQVSEVTRQSDYKDLFKLKIDELALKKRNISALPTAYGKRERRESVETNISNVKNNYGVSNQNKVDTSSAQFQSQFTTGADSAQLNWDTQNLTSANVAEASNKYNLADAKHYVYKPVKFSVSDVSSGVFNNVLFNRFQPYIPGNTQPIRVNTTSSINPALKIGANELFEDYRFNGALSLSADFRSNQWFFNFENLRRRIDWGFVYYRNYNKQLYNFVDGSGNSLGTYFTKDILNLYQVNLTYPIDEVKSIRLNTGLRFDNTAILPNYNENISLYFEPFSSVHNVNHIEFVHDNTLNPAQNIWNGLRYKVYMDFYQQIKSSSVNTQANLFNVGFDVRYYYPILGNFIWAGRAAGDFSWGKQKTIYYLGGVDGWLMMASNIKNNNEFRYYDASTPVDQTQNYVYQTLALNLRGYLQNAASGNNNVILNSEFRLPIFTTFVKKIVNDAFLRNLQVVQFIDLGSAWSDKISDIKRPAYYASNSNITVVKKTGGVGPFAGGYGFGLRSELLKHFIRFDAAWPMNTFFGTKPKLYLSLGFDF